MSEIYCDINNILKDFKKQLLNEYYKVKENKLNELHTKNIFSQEAATQVSKNKLKDFFQNSIKDNLILSMDQYKDFDLIGKINS